MTTHTEALKLALDALETYRDREDCIPTTVLPAIEAVKAALAEPAPQSEPVGWQWLDTAHFRKHLPKDANAAEWNPLYAHPLPTPALVRAAYLMLNAETQDQVADAYDALRAALKVVE